MLGLPLGRGASAGYQHFMFGPDGPRFSELVRQALSSTRGGYDLLAPKFDSTPFRTPDALLERVVAHLREGPRFGAAIDVCCGTGAVLTHLTPLCEKLVGVDFSRGMLEEAARAIRVAPGLAHQTNRPQLVRCDALRLPFREAFDLATCFGALGHFPPSEQPEFVRSIFDVLRPRGRFVFVTAEAPSPLRPAFWLGHGFNMSMRLRNALIRPQFIMYYLEFTLPVAVARLVEAGFEPEVKPLGWSERPELQLVIGHKPG